MSLLGTERRTPASKSSQQRPAWPLVFGALFVCAWSGNQFSPMLLLYKNFDHYSSVTVTSFLGIYVVGLVPALLIAGTLSDRFGRRPLMLAGICFGLLASLFIAAGEFGPLPIYFGRLLAGMSVGTAMAVGTSWLEELSQGQYDPAADDGAGARRATLAFTLGSGLGALVAGSLAQWGPIPEVLPYLIHFAVAAPFVQLIRNAPETVRLIDKRSDFPRTSFRVPSARHPRFLRVVVVCAPWLFVACALAYGYLPVLLEDATGGMGLAYATALSVIALGSGALVQPVAKRIDSTSSARGIGISLGTLIVGILLMAFAVETNSVVAGLVVSTVLGAGFGIGLVSGLLEVQRIAPPADLAKLTGASTRWPTPGSRFLRSWLR